MSRACSMILRAVVSFSTLDHAGPRSHDVFGGALREAQGPFEQIGGLLGELAFVRGMADQCRSALPASDRPAPSSCGSIPMESRILFAVPLRTR